MSDSYKIPEEYLGGKKLKPINDDIRYMTHALVESCGSVDPSTKVGACFVDKNGNIMSLGHNSPAWDEDKFPWGNNAKEIGEENTKYPYVYHAETNGVVNYDGNIKDFIGSTVYVTLYPCKECTKFLSQVGVKKIVYLNKRVYDSVDMSKVIMDNTGIESVYFKDEMDTERVDFDFTKDEKECIKVLKLKRTE